MGIDVEWFMTGEVWWFACFFMYGIIFEQLFG